MAFNMREVSSRDIPDSVGILPGGLKPARGRERASEDEERMINFKLVIIYSSGGIIY